MKKHTYEYDEIVVGGSLAAILYSYINQSPVFFGKQEMFFAHEYFQKDFPFENIFMKNEKNKIKTASMLIEAGTNKLRLYNRLLFILSLSGLVPFLDKAEKIRVEKENTLKIITKAKSIYVKYKRLRIFDAKDIEGLTQKKVINEKKIVHDKFKIKAAKHNLNYIKTSEDFVSEIIFDGEEILVVSRLNEDQIQEYDFSLIVMKYKIRDVLARAGIERRKTQKEIVVDYISRDVYNCDHIEYKKQKDITFDNREIEEICRDIPPHISHIMHSRLLDVYPWRLNHLLLDSNGMIR